MTDPIISAIHPKVLDAASAVVTEARMRKLSAGIHSGLRTAEKQNELYALGRTVVNPNGKSEDKPMGNVVTNAPAWKSWHLKHEP